MIQTLDTDYLIIGAGAAGMAFADELVSTSDTVRIIMVDRRATPGGHWNDAYRFVTLHQPSLYYGVNSESLETSPDHRASADEIIAYYARVLDKLCETGRVQFFGESDYLGEGRFRSMANGDQEYQVTVQRKTVDATYSRVTVPSTRAPEYLVAEGMNAVPVNALANLEREWSRYVVIGAGKTGIDAVLHLLDLGTDPDRITWVISNDVWMINREMMMPEDFAKETTKHLRTFCFSRSVEDYFRRCEETGLFMRLDPSVPAPRFRCATVNPTEIQALRTVHDIVRLGRVRRIESTTIVLDGGTIPTDGNVLHVDCTADGLALRPERPIFDGDHMVLQPVTLCQPAMSAAFIGHLEMTHMSDERKNNMAWPCPHPMVPRDYFKSIHSMGHNMMAWSFTQNRWLMTRRLSAMTHVSLWGKIWTHVGFLLWFFGAALTVKRFLRTYEEADA